MKSTEPCAYYIVMSGSWFAIAAGGSLLPVHMTGDRTQQQSTRLGTQNTLIVKHAPHTILNFLATNAVICTSGPWNYFFGIFSGKFSGIIRCRMLSSHCLSAFLMPSFRQEIIPNFGFIYPRDSHDDIVHTTFEITLSASDGNNARCVGRDRERHLTQKFIFRKSVQSD